MASNCIYTVACDLGSSGGKFFLGTLRGDELELEEIHRFSLQPVHAGIYEYTNILFIWHHILESLRKLSACGIQPHSLAIDTWGVDYAYLLENGELAGNPLNYRNPRTLGTIDKFKAAGWSAERLYRLTGNAVMPYNTLFQIYEDIHGRSCALKQASSLLFLPDLLAYWLCGRKSTERTIASTSQMIDLASGDWARDLLSEIGFPHGILPEIQGCGTQKGILKKELAESLGLKPFPIIAGGSHDTASAVAAAPLSGEGAVYLSSGSWSLLGVERSRPILTDEALHAGFTHEAGFGGRIRFLKGINGLWILQLLQRQWKISFPKIIAAAEQFADTPFIIDVADPRFYNPADIEGEIKAYCQETGQGLPLSQGEIAAAFYRGLADVYRSSVRQLETITGQKSAALHIVGGGSRDGLLNQLTAKALGIPIYVGPIESSALGNILIQLHSIGAAVSLEEMRSLVRDNFSIQKIL